MASMAATMEGLAAKSAALAMQATGVMPDNAKAIAGTLVGVGVATVAASCCSAMCAAPPTRVRRRAEPGAGGLKGQAPDGAGQSLQAEIERLEAKLKQRDEGSGGPSVSRGRRALHVETSETLGLMRGSLEHDAAVRCVVAAPAAQQLAVGLESGEVIVWDAGSCARLHTIHTKAMSGPVVAMAHEPSLQLTATACADGTVQLWDARWEEFGRVVPRPSADLIPTALVVLPPHAGSAHGSVCVGYNDGSITAWILTAAANRADVQTAAENPGLLLEQATQALHRGRTATRSSGTSTDVASLSQDVEGLRSSVDALLDAADQLMPLIGLAAGVSATPAGASSDAADPAGAGRTAGAASEKALKSVCGDPSAMVGHEEAVATLLWVEESAALVSGSYDTKIRVWSPRVATRPPPRSLGSGVSVASSVSSSGGPLWECKQVLGADDNDEFQSVRSVCVVTLDAHQTPAAAASTGGVLLASGHGDGRLKAWVVGGGDRPMGQAEGHYDDETDSEVTHVLCLGSRPGAGAASGAGRSDRYLASASEDGTVKLWAPETLLLPADKAEPQPLTTLQRGLAKVDEQVPPPVSALALVHAGTVPLLAVGAGETVDLWQIA